MRLTSGNLLDRMRYNLDYHPTYLAQRFNVTTAVVRDMLCMLVEEGRVEMTSKDRSVIKFRRVKAQPHDTARTSDQETLSDTSVATRPAPRTFGGNLNEYSASLMKHRALAMLTRG